MSLFKAFGLPVVLLVLASLALPERTMASWPHDPQSNLQLAAANGHQTSQVIASDGVGGAIVAWQDTRNDEMDIFAQHVLVSGVVDPAWPPQGLMLCAAMRDQHNPAIAADGSGGAIITWQDERDLHADIYAQHVLPTGQVDPRWPLNGLAICSARMSQIDPAIVLDAAGGAIVTWSDSRMNSAIYAERVLVSGDLDGNWPHDGRPLTSFGIQQYTPALIADATGGAIVTWAEFRDSPDADIFAQHILVSGLIDSAWPIDGVPVCEADNEQFQQTIVTDGVGGAIIAWRDRRLEVEFNIFAQHVLASGVVDNTWPVDGLVLCTAPYNQDSPRSVSDGTGGAIIAWIDSRDGNEDVYAGHVLFSGHPDPAWPVDGRALCTESSSQLYPAIAPDGSAGAIVSWADRRHGPYYDIYSSHITATGQVDVEWPIDGRAVSTAIIEQRYPQSVADGTGGVIIVWQDERDNVYDQLYAQRVDRYGWLGNPAPSIIAIHDEPNDQGGIVTLHWNASYLDSALFDRIGEYWVLREPINMGGEWEHVATVVASNSPIYSCQAPTPGDSTEGSGYNTNFRIEARDAKSSGHWESISVVGYSVDNIAPATPANLRGQYSDGSTLLSWNANAEPDIATYRLHRGEQAGFNIAPDNFVAIVVDTTYTDAANAPYCYKLAAVDVHGNVGAFASVLPVGTVGAPVVGRASLILDGIRPNPTRASVLTVRFELPSSESATLELLDLAGRRVTTNDLHSLGRGRHAISLSVGSRLRPGLYVLRLSQGMNVQTTRVVILG